ncbi:hypothetical protein J7F03_17825 [Streptomyces sp. ISL-43]|uniref:hypothetical protein n=1 Tax=Streptomyces sp. ISL-43 TaxID=2819183 RepID=UPI001BE6987F|nr:hypothetical protein [Streptomyces sp. ISL-43]MBT2448918.1 hypothetical protein [Streptomyces sp. ISL-43]
MDDSQAGYRLERGATGFRHISEPPLPDTDIDACRAAWHAAARAAGGQVGDFVEQRYPQNFHSATITDQDGTHVALFHAHHPLIAFVDERRYAFTDEFQDPPAWAAPLTDHGFVILSASLLRSPFSEADASALADAEWNQIKYWEPETVGTVLFNFWD